MPSIRIVMDTREVVKTLKDWEKTIGIASTRMPTKLAKSARRGYLQRIAKFRWGVVEPSINAKSVILKTSKGRKTADLSVNAPHAASIEFGMKPHFVPLTVVGDTLKPGNDPRSQRLLSWIETKGRKVYPAAVAQRGLFVGSPNSPGAFNKSVRAGGGPFEKSIKNAYKRAGKELKNLARKLK